MGEDNVFHPPDHNKYGLFNVTINPWNTPPSICVILAGVGGVGTQAATRFFIDLLRNRITPMNNKEAPDYPGHIVTARVKEYVKTGFSKEEADRSEVVSLDETKGWELVE